MGFDVRALWYAESGRGNENNVEDARDGTSGESDVSEKEEQLSL